MPVILLYRYHELDCYSVCTSTLQQGFTRSRAFSRCIRLAMGDAPLDIRGWRNPYLNKEEPVVLEENLPTRDPHKLFDIWFKKIAEAKATTFEELNTCAFSTVGK
ncbi:hypothetical protein Y032_0770g2212 [Ancylostoma ceylanicum]|uniref:Uncharacterized protein n=1 Tax=Ancylostoma ceylanicum TaxID=53326 RepID=A0A016WDM9_9BILA|nr:hypothetical protein Y032_0770g2212 [Ancylostoma ceylanicum]